MKNLLAILLLFSGGVVAQTDYYNQKNYVVEIFDFDYSMAYTTHYRIVNDSLILPA